MADALVPEPAADPLLCYLAKREAARVVRVQAFLDSLNPRERALMKEVAVMGYVRGTLHPAGETVPKEDAILAQVIDACFAFPDLYPAIAVIERHPRFPEDCPNLRLVPAPAPEQLRGVRCGCGDDPTEGSL
ncbi:hypothetical protein ABZ404_36990 [Streptomyces sp. NPDC005878]|uniref:hypothetical protein n=1 Tax=Streptomyces sp. NPDC005878 TaxID=3157077 RepID=UPI0033CB4DF7